MSRTHESMRYMSMNINECIKTKESIKKYYEWINILNYEQFKQQLSAIIDDLINAIPVLSEEIYGIVTDCADAVMELLTKKDIRRTELNEVIELWLSEIENDINALSERFCI